MHAHAHMLVVREGAGPCRARAHACIAQKPNALADVSTNLDFLSEDSDLDPHKKPKPADISVACHRTAPHRTTPRRAALHRLSLLRTAFLRSARHSTRRRHIAM